MIFNHFLTLSSAVTRCFSIEIMSSAIGLKICAITGGIKNSKPKINKNKKKHNKIVLLTKTKLNSK